MQDHVVDGEISRWEIIKSNVGHHAVSLLGLII